MRLYIPTFAQPIGLVLALLFVSGCTQALTSERRTP